MSQGTQKWQFYFSRDLVKMCKDQYFSCFDQKLNNHFELVKFHCIGKFWKRCINSHKIGQGCSTPLLYANFWKQMHLWMKEFNNLTTSIFVISKQNTYQFPIIIVAGLRTDNTGLLHIYRSILSETNSMVMHHGLEKRLCIDNYTTFKIITAVWVIISLLVNTIHRLSDYN